MSEVLSKKIERLEQSVLTMQNVESSLYISTESQYAQILGAQEIMSTVSLLEADSPRDTDRALSGHYSDDVLPSTPARETTTGLLPPADEAQIEYQRVQNKQATTRDQLKHLLEMNELTLADTKGYRIRVAYRLVRQIARLKGELNGWARLQPIFDLSPYGDGVSGWSSPTMLQESFATTGFRGVRNILAEIENGKDRYTFLTNKGYRTRRGSTPLPPPIPDSLFNTRIPAEIWKKRVAREIPPDYSPAQDRALCLFCEAATVAAHQMGIHKGAPEEPWSGVYGLAGLLSPQYARIAWPTRDELILFEEELLLHIFDKRSVVSEAATQRYLHQFFGFGRFEAVDLVKTAVDAGGILYSETAEDQRTILLKRLDSVMDKCADSCDPRAELSAVKVKAQLLGLTANDENDTVAAMRDAAVRTLKRPDDIE